MDPILAPNPNRFTTFPIKYNGLWELYKKAVSSFWTVEEIDLSGDIKDWELLTINERNFIKMVLAFFAASDFEKSVIAVRQYVIAKNPELFARCGQQ